MPRWRSDDRDAIARSPDASLAEMAGSLPQTDRIMVIGFDARTYLACDLTDGRDSVRRALLAMRPVGGNSALFDTLVATKERLDAISGRKAVLLVTDGMDVGSGFGDGEVARAAIQSANISWFVVQYDTTASLQVPSMTRYSSSKPAGEKLVIPPDGLPDATEAFRHATEYLKAISLATGGTFELAKTPDALAPALARIADRLK